MRITMQSIHANILTNLNQITEDMNRINNQISSGKQMSKISDDPVNLITALGLRSNLAELGQYKENLVFGEKVINASEDALVQIKDLTMRAKTLAIQQNNASVTAENRLSAAEEVKHLWDQAILLANSEVNGKYIFGGYRTSGYTTAEPAPFVADRVDGYLINGQALSTENQYLTATLPAAPTGDIAAGDLLINGKDVAALYGATIDLTSAGPLNGLNMDGSLNLVTALNSAAVSSQTTVTANLTTLTYSSAATGAATSNGTISFDLNGVAVSVNVSNGDSAAATNAALVAAVNAVTDQTGVKAVIGNGSNGAAADTLILQNALAGDSSDIVIGSFTNTAAGTNVSLANGNQAADATHNTGQVSLASANSFAITTSAADDTILDRLGLGAGNLGFADVDGDGKLRYGSSLATGDLLINGIAIPASSADNDSTVFADASAAAKAAAINGLKDTTGVRAEVTPASRQATGAVVAGTMGSGDLVINGVDIFASSTAIVSQDTDNVLLNAINNQSGSTGVVATRDSDGVLLLSAIDGRNLHVKTSANGENLTSLNGAGSDTPASKVYFGTVHLLSDQQFTLKTTPVGTTPTIYEPGLAALGLAGGQAVTGEAGDVVDDGLLTVSSIAKRDGSVRYAGDRDNDIAIKVGSSSSLEVSKNGKKAIVDTGVFSVLKSFEDTLRGTNFSTVTGIKQATDTTAKLDSGNTGLENDNLSFADGTITLTVTDHYYYPPQDLKMVIPVDASEDSPASLAGKINGTPGLSASWSSDGYLTIQTDDPNRYSFSFTDSSHFLKLSGITTEQMQLQALDTSIADLETLMEDLSSQISDFGARANRIEVQQQIYTNLELSTKESLSEQEDTDIMKALMEIKAKDVAYQAALSAAAKTMQLSLVNYL